MVKWNELKLSEKWSTRRRFNYIMNYIDSLFKDNAVSNVTDETPVTESEVVEDVEPIENLMGSVIVSVRDDEDNKVASAKVTLTKDENRYSGTTGSAGGCTIRDVPYGNYNVEVTAEGYIDNIDTVIVDEETINLEIIIQIE